MFPGRDYVGPAFSVPKHLGTPRHIITVNSLISHGGVIPEVSWEAKKRKFSSYLLSFCGPSVRLSVCPLVSICSVSVSTMIKFIFNPFIPFVCSCSVGCCVCKWPSTYQPVHLSTYHTYHLSPIAIDPPEVLLNVNGKRATRRVVRRVVARCCDNT